MNKKGCKLNKKIGTITKRIIKILNLDYTEEKPIFIGKSNIEHIALQEMKKKSIEFIKNIK